MPVGTAATVKGIFHRDVRDEAQAQIIWPTPITFICVPVWIFSGGRRAPLLDWDGPMLTGGGGFQVFSLGCRRLRRRDAISSPHIDGSRHLFTPRKRDRHGAYDRRRYHDGLRRVPAGRLAARYAAKSLALTERWLDRCFNRCRQTSPKYGHYQALFPIVQGCTYPDLRARAAENVKQYDADGYAIGGLAVGEPTDVIKR